ncbi:MAG: prolyl oligopeptidase family serine peptidase [Carbonactinosporaceae bacterium]
MPHTDAFPRQAARTQSFTLGTPRTFTVTDDRVVFLRAPSGTDRSTGLWVLDLADGGERRAADPHEILAGEEERLSPQERALRERRREGSGGIVGYATDRAARLAAFTLSGRLYVTDLGDRDAGAPRRLDTPTPVFDPRPDPAGRTVAYVHAGTLRVVSADGTGDRALVEPDGPGVTWGLAEFIAAEEMGRSRGYWWSPDGSHLLVARVDDTAVARWYIADPAQPAVPPAELAYPAAGTANAAVTLALAGLDGSRVPVHWDTGAFPYLVTVHWSEGGPPLLAVQSRDQRALRVLAVDTATGQTEVRHEQTDPAWVDIVPGVPAWTPDGRLVHVTARDGAYRLAVGGRELTGTALQVRTVVAVADDGVLVTASRDDPAEIHVARVAAHGVEWLTGVPGVHSAASAGDVTVVAGATLDRFGPAVRVLRRTEGRDREIATTRSYAATPDITPRVTLLRAGQRRLRTALVLPSRHEPGSGRLPVLLDPYGGPHGQRVVAARNAYLTPQWFADQGFAVLVADGRGTPGRGPEWERAVALDLADVPLQDQVDALHAVAETHPDLDLSRVAIRGWSFGGYLAALAVLRRPDVFHAAIAGAPVTDMRLYDTHYTERYLGMPQERPEVYEANSLLADAEKLARPLLLIHGLADDNVVAAHTLRLSAALLAAGRPHSVLPLSGVTHMTPQEVVAENLLLLQAEFLHRALDR